MALRLRSFLFQNIFVPVDFVWGDSETHPIQEREPNRICNIQVNYPLLFIALFIYELLYTVHACDRAMCSFTHRHGVSKSNILRRLKCNSKPISCILFEKPTYTMSCRTCRLRHLMIRSRRGIASLILCKHHFEAGHFLCAAHSKMMWNR